MKKANEDIRTMLKEKKIPVYAVADVLGVHDNTLFRRLRFELSTQEKLKLINIIDELATSELENDQA